MKGLFEQQGTCEYGFWKASSPPERKRNHREKKSEVGGRRGPNRFSH